MCLPKAIKDKDSPPGPAEGLPEPGRHQRPRLRADAQGRPARRPRTGQAAARDAGRDRQGGGLAGDGASTRSATGAWPRPSADAVAIGEDTSLLGDGQDGQRDAQGLRRPGHHADRPGRRIPAPPPRSARRCSGTSRTRRRCSPTSPGATPRTWRSTRSSSGRTSGAPAADDQPPVTWRLPCPSLDSVDPPATTSPSREFHHALLRRHDRCRPVLRIVRRTCSTSIRGCRRCTRPTCSPERADELVAQYGLAGTFASFEEVLASPDGRRGRDPDAALDPRPARACGRCGPASTSTPPSRWRSAPRRSPRSSTPSARPG